MVTLPDQSTTTTHLPPLPHLHQTCQSLPETIASILTPPTTHTQHFSTMATLHDYPTTIPVTTAASDALDNEWPQAHSSSVLLEETIPETTPSFSKHGTPFIMSLFDQLHIKQ